MNRLRELTITTKADVVQEKALWTNNLGFKKTPINKEFKEILVVNEKKKVTEHILTAPDLCKSRELKSI